MARNQITIADIAKAAQVSAGTVSNALNDRKGISPDKKQEILDIADRLGYRKSTEQREAREIRFVLFKRHGFVVDDTPFFSQLISGIEAALRMNGYRMLITQLNLTENHTRETLDSLKSDSCNGVIVLATEMIRDDLVLFSSFKKPIVFLDNCFRDNHTDCVSIANEESAYAATALIIHSGHTRVGLLSSSTHINNFYYRKRGFEMALHDYGLELLPAYEVSICPTIEGSYRDMKAMLADGKNEFPTAFFAENDIIAQGAMRALREYGIRVPEDVSIVGFDDMPFCELLTPRLTTVNVNKQNIGEEAVSLLLRRIQDDRVAAITTFVKTELVKRDSLLDMKANITWNRALVADML
jgi:LacI family transcriptional regulator